MLLHFDRIRHHTIFKRSAYSTCSKFFIHNLFILPYCRVSSSSQIFKFSQRKIKCKKIFFVLLNAFDFVLNNLTIQNFNFRNDDRHVDMNNYVAIVAIRMNACICTLKLQRLFYMKLRKKIKEKNICR